MGMIITIFIINIIGVVNVLMFLISIKLIKLDVEVVKRLINKTNDMMKDNM